MDGTGLNLSTRNVKSFGSRWTNGPPKDFADA